MKKLLVAIMFVFFAISCIGCSKAAEIPADDVSDPTVQDDADIITDEEDEDWEDLYSHKNYKGTLGEDLDFSELDRLKEGDLFTLEAVYQSYSNRAYDFAPPEGFDSDIYDTLTISVKDKTEDNALSELDDSYYKDEYKVRMLVVLDEDPSDFSVAGRHALDLNLSALEAKIIDAEIFDLEANPQIDVIWDRYHYYNYLETILANFDQYLKDVSWESEETSQPSSYYATDINITGTGTYNNETGTFVFTFVTVSKNPTQWECKKITFNEETVPDEDVDAILAPLLLRNRD